VYTSSTTPDSFELRAEAALAALPLGALSHLAAARVLAFGLDEESVEISVPPGTRNRLAGVRIHQSPLPGHHVIRRGGFRLTNVERTLVDLGKVLGPTKLQRCIEDQVITRRTTVARIESMFAELARRGRPGIGRVRTVLGRLDEDPPTESELEAMFWRLLERLQLELPERQASFDWLGHGRGRVDFWYPEHQLVVELDGRRFHLRVAAYEEDRRREQVGLLHGITTVRFTHRQMTTEAHHIGAVMSSLLAG
jgi:very-short-patch-repair endonuclease